MRTPKTRNKPVDDQRISRWLGRFDGYRITVTAERIKEFIGGFQRKDIDLGARILDAVTFYRSEDLEEAIRKAVDRLPGWNRDTSQRLGEWRFVAFSVSEGESGHTMLHKARTALGLTGKQHNSLFVHKSDLLRARLGPDDSVVFIDDFAGTGQQACEAWPALAELLPGGPKPYLVVVAAGDQALRRIAQETGLRVYTHHKLSASDNIFSDTCRHFTGAEKDDLLAYCKRADRKNPRGYGACGFVIVLAHKTPNNSLPILHASHEHWKGLFPRH